MKKLLFACVCLLVGCAVTPERAAKMSNYDLCEAYYSPFSSQESRIAAGSEAKNRDFDCRTLRAQIERDYDRAFDDLDRNLKQAGQPAIPPPRNCTTYPRSDGTYVTHCR